MFTGLGDLFFDDLAIIRRQDTGTLGHFRVRFDPARRVG